jgi:hypothetical protein
VVEREAFSGVKEGHGLPNLKFREKEERKDAVKNVGV